MKMSLTVDGFVGGVKGENDWIFKSSDPQSLAWSVGLASESGLIIMGRKSFEQMAPYWPTANGPFAAPMNEISKAVFTQKGFKGFDPGPAPSPAAKSWADARIFSGDLSEGIRQLKQEPGKHITAMGGAGFMRSLIATGMIDEYVLATHPIVLGSGLPIFTNLSKSLDLKLTEIKSFPKGIVVRTYQPA
jgi:dihydrofolate reductase